MTTDWRKRTGPIGVLTGAGISTDSGIPDFENGADLVIVNAEETSYDEYATELVREPIGVALPRIVADLLV